MGAGMMFILLLVIVAAVIAAMVFTGTGAALWTKKAAHDEPSPTADPGDEERVAPETPDATVTPDSTVAPDAQGVYHREFR